MSFVRFTMIVQQSDLDEGEDDGMRPEATKDVYINRAQVRNFYARNPARDGTPRRGTRIAFVNGSGCPVAEEVDEVLSRLGQAN